MAQVSFFAELLVMEEGKWCGGALQGRSAAAGRCHCVNNMIAGRPKREGMEGAGLIFRGFLNARVVKAYRNSSAYLRATNTQYWQVPLRSAEALWGQLHRYTRTVLLFRCGISDSPVFRLLAFYFFMWYIFLFLSYVYCTEVLVNVSILYPLNDSLAATHVYCQTSKSCNIATGIPCTLK